MVYGRNLGHFRWIVFPAKPWNLILFWLLFCLYYQHYIHYISSLVVDVDIYGSLKDNLGYAYSTFIVKQFAVTKSVQVSCAFECKLFVIRHDNLGMWSTEQVSFRTALISVGNKLWRNVQRYWDLKTCYFKRCFHLFYKSLVVQNKHISYPFWQKLSCNAFKYFCWSSACENHTVQFCMNRMLWAGLGKISYPDHTNATFPWVFKLFFLRVRAHRFITKKGMK